MVDLKIKHHFSEGVYAKQMHLPAGSEAVTHEHKYDHLSILASGIVAADIDGVTTIHTGPTAINIPAGKKHRICALKDSVWFCVHATEEKDPEKVDEVLICHSQR
jgi:quercetin dioxygenase-like cupin family protein